MQVFKCAMRIIRAHISFPLIYIVGLSFMGILMAFSFNFGQTGDSDTYEPEKGTFAVVNRDGSALSNGMTEALGEFGEQVEVEDSRLAFQDAVAKGSIDYLLIVPENYGADFIDAARNGDSTPVMDTVYSYYSLDGAYMDEVLNSYLGAARTFAISNSDASPENIADDALDAVSHRAKTSIISTGASMPEADRFVFYMQWSTYTLFAGITVCVGMLVAAMGRSDVRRRNLASPMHFAAYSLQLALACLVFTIAAWVWSFGIGICFFPAAIAELSVPGIIWCALSMLSFCMIPLGVGFLLGQLGASNMATNAAGNIFGLVISFLGGAWISLDIMPPEILSVAKCLPGYWYNIACKESAHLSAAPSLDAVSLILGDMGILLLFAAAIFAAGMLAGRIRVQPSGANSNAVEVTE